MNINIVEITTESIERQATQFGELLKTIDRLDEKKRALWMEIYCNALNDRHNSFVMFKRLADLCDSKTTELAIHGKTISSYLERISRSNDQLIKLAELIERADRASEPFDADSLYDQITKT